MASLAGVKIGFWLTGKLGRAWVSAWVGVWVHGWCDVVGSLTPAEDAISALHDTAAASLQ